MQVFAESHFFKCCMFVFILITGSHIGETNKKRTISNNIFKRLVDSSNILDQDYRNSFYLNKLRERRERISRCTKTYKQNKTGIELMITSQITHEEKGIEKPGGPNAILNNLYDVDTPNQAELVQSPAEKKTASAGNTKRKADNREINESNLKKIAMGSGQKVQSDKNFIASNQQINQYCSQFWRLLNHPQIEDSFDDDISTTSSWLHLIGSSISTIESEITNYSENECMKIYEFNADSIRELPRPLEDSRPLLPFKFRPNLENWNHDNELHLKRRSQEPLNPDHHHKRSSDVSLEFQAGYFEEKLADTSSDNVYYERKELHRVPGMQFKDAFRPSFEPLHQSRYKRQLETNDVKGNLKCERGNLLDVNKLINEVQTNFNVSDNVNQLSKRIGAGNFPGDTKTIQREELVPSGEYASKDNKVYFQNHFYFSGPMQEMLCMVYS